MSVESVAQALLEAGVLDATSVEMRVPRARTARLVQSFGTPGVSTTIGGSVQALPDGHTLVSFGTAGRVEEYDARGQIVWQIVGNPGYVFRAQRIRSLYAPGAELRP